MTRTEANAVRREDASPPGAVGAGRYDSYLMVHKALRALQAETLIRLGRMDPDDDEDTDAVLAQVRQLIELSAEHLRKEDAFVHPAMEQRAPGSTQHAANDHVTHGRALARILAGCDEVEHSRGAARAAAALCLYRGFALFMAEDLVHMHVEETENNAVLWATHTDAEIMEISGRIVASIPPAHLAMFMRWMVPANAPRDRAQLLGGMKDAMPPERFAGFLASVRPYLPAPDRDKLDAALA